MRLSQAIARVQFAIDSVAAKKYDPAGSQIVAVLNAQVRSMVRKMTELDRAYTNHRFVLSAAAARTVHAGDFSYRLPPWVSKLVQIRQSQTAGSGAGQPIHRTTKWQRGGWRYSALNEITLTGFSQAIDLEIECAKVPALLTKGTLQSGSTSTTLKLDADNSADAANFPHETPANGYAGAVFEITGGAGAGQVLRCVGNTTDVTGRVLTMEEAWATTPTTDTYEMHAEIPEEHTELLVLLTARRLLAQQGNAKALALYAQELGEQWAAFTRHIESRDLQEPYYIAASPLDFVPTGTEMT